MATITVRNLTTPGTFTATQFYNLVWALRYQALYHYNRSPWVEHGYAEKCDDIIEGQGGWNIELLDSSDQEGALGYHEDEVHTSTQHSTRGLSALETPLAKVFCRTAKESGVEPSEVASHEVLEMLVDPYVTDEAKIRKYVRPETKQWYIGEVGDPVQGRGYDVGAPEGRTVGVVVADFALPAWWGQAQRRTGVSFTESPEDWKGPTPNSGLKPWQLAREGYISVKEEGGEWYPVYGDRAKHSPDPT